MHRSFNSQIYGTGVVPLIIVSVVDPDPELDPAEFDIRCTQVCIQIRIRTDPDSL
jgi:hypothetical protein